jgi:hypothetical protein
MLRVRTFDLNIRDVSGDEEFKSWVETNELGVIIITIDKCGESYLPINKKKNINNKLLCLGLNKKDNNVNLIIYYDMDLSDAYNQYLKSEFINADCKVIDFKNKKIRQHF